MGDDMSNHIFDVIVVGAGPSGIGVSVALRDAGIDDIAVLDRREVGASLQSWPAETRFITPSFPTNSIGMLDINSIAVGTSPATYLKAEHPTGSEYAKYLAAVAQHFEIPVYPGMDVQQIVRIGEAFRVDVGSRSFKARHVIWAAGEYQYPNVPGFSGSEHCQHTSTISSYAEMDGDDFIVIGGYESGIDAAYHLALKRRCVRVFDCGCPWERPTSDPSVALSTYSLERMRERHFRDHVSLHPNTAVVKVIAHPQRFEVQTDDGHVFYSAVAPLYAGGFDGGHGLVSNLFEARDDGFPVLTEDDESTIVPGIFLCGPAVRHDDLIFCFIYKYRQRFAVVAKAIATALGRPAEELEMYRDWGMYLDDLSCCGEECVC